MDRTEAGTVAILPGFPIEDYLQSAGNGWNGETCAGYRRALCELARSLVGQGPPTPAAVQAWRQDLERRGYRPRSINSRLAAANGYFRWCGRYDLLLHYVPPTRAALPAMTRPEYLRLLCVARSGGQQQLYLLVKLFALTGLPLQCLPGVTPAVVQAGGGMLPCRGQPFALQLPDCLQQELLAYIARQGITAGPVFLSRSGRPINRSNLCRKLQELCRAAHVPEEKGNPRSLRALYQATRDELAARAEQLLRQSYHDLLEAEQAAAGWQTSA